MDNYCKRFPNASKLTFKNLDNQSLVRSKNAGRRISSFLENETFHFKRIIKSYNGKFEGFEESWREVIKKTPIDVLKQLSIAVQKYFKKHPTKRNVSPHEIALKKGNIDLCKYMITKTSNRNPVIGSNESTLLHHSAKSGHFDLCELIVENIDEKNPANMNGETPLHLAAKNCHWNICHLIIEKVDEKNPANNSGYTPLHSAAKKGNLSICQLIIDFVDNKNPADNHGMTPLHLLAKHGYLESHFTAARK